MAMIQDILRRLKNTAQSVFARSKAVDILTPGQGLQELTPEDVDCVDKGAMGQTKTPSGPAKPLIDQQGYNLSPTPD